MPSVLGGIQALLMDMNSAFQAWQGWAVIDRQARVLFLHSRRGSASCVATIPICLLRALLLKLSLWLAFWSAHRVFCTCTQHAATAVAMGGGKHENNKCGNGSFCI